MKYSARLLLVPIAFVVFASAVNCLPSCTMGSASPARLTLLVSGDVDGYLKNCGCSGGQLGGEIRKARVIRNEHEEALRPMPSDKGRRPGVLVIDTGNFVDGRKRISELYSEGVVASMATLDYDCVGIGLNELMYSDRNERGKVQEKLWNLLGDKKLPLTAANLIFVPPPDGTDYSDQLNGLIEPYRIVRLEGGYRVGIVHIVDTRMLRAEQERVGVELSDMAGTAQSILDEHRKEADLWILSVGGTELYKSPPLDVAALSEYTIALGYDKPNPLEGDSTEVMYPYFISRPFPKAKSIVRSKIYFGDDDQLRILGEHVALNPNVGTDEKVEQIIAELQDQLESLEIRQTELLLQSKGPSPWYEGKETCRACHTEIYDFLEDSRHSHAYQSLVGVDKERNADCLPCHVTGHGTDIGGWNILTNNVPEYQNVTCESCHGPGEYHTAMMAARMSGQEYEAPEDLKSNGRNEFGMIRPRQRDCRVCHDATNSVDFRFDRYWAKIDHTEEGMSAAKELRNAEGRKSGGDDDGHEGHDH